MEEIKKLVEIRKILVCNFDDRPEFKFGEINNKSFTIRVSDTPFRLVVSVDSTVKIYGKGTDVDGDILNYTNYNELANIVLIYAWEN